MKPIVFMFYYVNIHNLSRQDAEEMIHRMIRLTKIENDDYDIIQQYFPTVHEPTRVDVVSVPEIKIEDNDLAKRIHKNIEKIVGQFESNTLITNIADLHG